MNFLTRFKPRRVPGLRCAGGLTQQHFKDDCDINTILRKYRAVPPSSRPSFYGDYRTFPADLTEAYNQLSVVHDWFGSLPSEVRQSFENDPLRAWRAVMKDPLAAQEKGLLPPSDSFGAVPPVKPAEGDHSQAAAAAKPEPATDKAGKGEAVASEAGK